MIARLEENLDPALFLRQPGGDGLIEPGQILFEAIAHRNSVIEDRRSGLQTVTLSVDRHNHRLDDAVNGYTQKKAVSGS